jgi:hypothetical protein
MVMPRSRSRSIESRIWSLGLARGDGVGRLQEPIGERGLAVVDVGDDREVADVGGQGRALQGMVGKKGEVKGQRATFPKGQMGARGGLFREPGARRHG